MRSTFYDVLSDYYDFLQQDIDNKAWAEYVHALALLHCSSSGDGSNGSRILCDLGCGTGKTTIEFVKHGYDVIGIDNSDNMLNEARELSAGMENTLWLLQDITEYELFGTVDVMVSLLDTVNHITDAAKIDKIFASFKNYLNVGGVFIFDIGTKHHFQNTLGDNLFCQDYDNFTLIWDNEFDNDMSVSSLTIFHSKDGENYKRVDGTIREKYYSLELINELAVKNNLKVAGIYGDMSMDKPEADDERIFVVIKREE